MRQLRDDQRFLYEDLQSWNSIAEDPLLQAISGILDRVPQILTEIHADLVEGLKAPQEGRRGLSADQVLRFGILKALKGWSYRETRDLVEKAPAFRKFVRVYDMVPKYTAFNRAILRLKPETMEAVNHTLVREAYRSGVEEGRRSRVDTTAIEKNIHYPTDSSLLWDCVRVTTRIVKRIGDLSPRCVLGFHDRTRRMKRRCYLLGRVEGKRKAKGKARKARKLFGELLAIAEEVREGAREVLARAERKPTGNAVLDAVLSGLCVALRDVLDATGKVISQTHRRIFDGEKVPASEKLLSLFEQDTEIIVRGKARTPVEFGKKVLLQEGESGIITGYRVLTRTPSDSGLLPHVLDKHLEVFGRLPEELSADRGFFKTDEVRKAEERGVRLVSIPHRGKPAADRKAFERTREFRKAQRFRAGIEGRISVLKQGRKAGRCLWKGARGFELFVGFVVLANNLMKFATGMAGP